jgi:hypothetical protein
VRDVRARDLADRQFNRIARRQLVDAGLSDHAIAHRVATGTLVVVEPGVFGFAPVLEHDEWGVWMGATLTSPESRLSHASAGAARGFWSLPRAYEIVTRPGSGGPRRHGGVLVFRSSTIAEDGDELDGIPITTAERTLVDLASHVSPRGLARAVREACRLGHTTTPAMVDYLRDRRGRRGTGALATTLARYAGLPIERARSGAEVRALEVLRESGYALPTLNERIAGEEADLSWRGQKAIVEVDGGPFHLDVGEDARKEAAWRAAGWTVWRISSDDVYRRPNLLLALARDANVPR